MGKRINTIKEILQSKGKSLYWLSNESDISYSLLHAYISGKSEPKLETLMKIAKTLRVSIKDLVRD